MSSGAVTNEEPSSDAIVARTLSPGVRDFANAARSLNSLGVLSARRSSDERRSSVRSFDNVKIAIDSCGAEEVPINSVRNCGQCHVCGTPRFCLGAASAQSAQSVYQPIPLRSGNGATFRVAGWALRWLCRSSLARALSASFTML